MYTVYQNDFHGGAEIKTHRTLKAALKTAVSRRCDECQCGGPTISDETGNNMGAVLVAYDYYHHYSKNPKAEAIDKAVVNYESFAE